MELSAQFHNLSEKIIRYLSNIAVKGQVLILNDINLVRAKIGDPEFDSILSMAKLNAAAQEHRSSVIALKYIEELSLLFNRVKDFDVNYCINLLNDFYVKSEVRTPVEIERYARDQFKELIDYMKVNRGEFGNNPKLVKLVELMKKCHDKDSRG